jgi:hypothetical protein
MEALICILLTLVMGVERFGVTAPTVPAVKVAVAKVAACLEKAGLDSKRCLVWAVTELFFFLNSNASGSRHG